MPDIMGKRQEPVHILVVTQKKADRDFIEKHLKPEGFQILQAESCDDAYEMIMHQPVDLLIIDVTAEKNETESLCRLLHNRKDTAPIPIIAINDPGSADEHNGSAAVETGADDFLNRPLKMPALLVRVRALMRLKDLHEYVSRRNTELEILNQKLASRNEELEQGLEMAHRLQNTLLPQHYPKVKNVSFYHIYSPADAIGGDIFQIAPLSENKAVVFLSDVSGHGIRAALVTSILKTVFGHVNLEDNTVAQILSDINSRFQNIMGTLTPSTYATAFIMIIDGEKRSVSQASAGHVCPFLISKSNMSCSDSISFENVGPALGFFQNPEYRQEETELSAGDIILGFTDGIFEVTNKKGEVYGLDRLQQLIKKNTHLVPRDMIEKILRDTDAFRRNTKRPDDICMVAAEVH